jgi:predicted Kef-type K+ transport protein
METAQAIIHLMPRELVWLGSAYLAGLLATRLWLPPLVGYLAVGYLLNLIGYRSEPALVHFSEIGILLLLFTVGLKIKLRSLLKLEVMGVGSLHLLVVAGASGLWFLFEQQHLTGGLLLGMSLAFSSTVLAVKVLEDNRELETFHGRTVMGILILQDVVAVGMLAMVGAKTPSPWALALLGLPLLRPVAVWLYDATGNDELRLLLGVLLAFAGGELARALGVSEDLGALLMGALLASHPDANDLSRKLWGLKEVMLVAFFLDIGLLGMPTGEELLISARLLLLLPLQGGLIFALLLLTGLRARTAFVASLAMTTYSEFALIVIYPMIRSGLIDPHWQSELGFAVACSLALAGLLNRYSHALFARLEPWLLPLERRVPHPDQIPVDLGNTRWLIVGMGRTGRAAYDVMNQSRHKVLGLDADPVRVARLKLDGVRAAYGDVEDPDLWTSAVLDHLHGIILALPDFDARRLGVKRLRDQGFTGLIGTTSYHAHEDPILYRTGADVVLHPFADTGTKLGESLLALEEQMASEPSHPDAVELPRSGEPALPHG